MGEKVNSKLTSYLLIVSGQSPARISQSSVAVNFGAAALEVRGPAAVRL